MADDLIAGNTPSTGETPAVPAAPAASATPPASQAAPQQPVASATGDTSAAEAKPPADTPAPSAPEKYEFKAPEGTEFDAGVIAAYSEVAKELNLPQEAAQKVLDKVAPVMAAQQAEAIKTVQAEWLAATKSDKEFGGEHLDANVAIAKKALDTFGTPELRELLNTTGLGNHPDMIRAFYRAGKAISEDRFVGGSAAPAGAPSVAQRMYPNMNP